MRSVLLILLIWLIYVPYEGAQFGQPKYVVDNVVFDHGCVTFSQNHELYYVCGNFTAVYTEGKK